MSQRWIAAYVVGLSIAALVASCAEHPMGVPCASCPDTASGGLPDTGLVLSDPVPQPTSVSRVAGRSPTGGGTLIYISVLPGTRPHAARLVVRNPSNLFALTASMTDGGIDPIPVPAVVGDSLLVVVTDSGGNSVRYAQQVKPIRAVKVVRTEPKGGGTDVPLNAAIVIVFSEPMDSASITPQTVHLLASGQQVSAHVAPALDGLRAVVTADAGLSPQTKYRLTVTSGVMNLSGQSLAGPDEVDFTTGSTTSLGRSTDVSPLTATIPVGSVLQLTVTVRDAAGNAVHPQFGQVQWSASNPAATVSQSGLARALQPGSDTILATFVDSGGAARGAGAAYIDVVPAPMLIVEGAWDWTETIVDPTNHVTCNDTGTYVFTQTGSTFTGTSQQVGACSTPSGTVDNASLDAVGQGRAGGNSLSFAVGSNCAYGATAAGSPDSLSGTLSCGPTATGTWAAHRPHPLALVAVLPSPLLPMVHGDTVRIRAALRDGAGNRVFARPVTWTSDNAAVATVSGVADSAVLIATGPGSTTIRAAAEGQSSSAALTVTAAGTIRVTTTTTGVDLDADGYLVNVDGGTQVAVTINGVKALTPIRAGSHSVALSGIADNCTVTPPNPSVVTVALTQTTDVTFAVTCTAAGSLQVTTTSTGTDIPAAYGVQVDGGPLLSVNANGQLTVSPVGARSHTTGLEEPVNCVVAGTNPRTVNVTAGATAVVAFQVNCAPIGRVAFNNLGRGFISMSADGSGVLPFPVAGYQAAWSPNGARIAFMPAGTDCSGAPASTVVCVMNADGTGVVGLPITTTISQAGLSWSPDGSKIAFVGSGGLYTVNVNSGGTAQLTSAVIAGFPVWSPDGSKIAFTCVVDTGNNDICSVNADGTGLVRLTSDPADDHHPSWRPDGAKIAFGTSRFGFDGSGNPTIAMMNPDGSGVTAIAVGDAPAWSPDGGRIALMFVPINSCDEFGCGPPVFAVIRSDGSGLTTPGGGLSFQFSADAPAWKP
ncbi:MAG TPA: Ig-like domain-containing protein [Gemmatimonadales bacterium]|jgi:hypothetical protein|nr:Ig-like domain-containing protein [Gemmatimonadales bacterium]